MRIDLAKLNEIVDTMYVAVVSRAFGSPGTAALRQMLTTIRSLFIHIEPECINGTFVIYHPLAVNDLTVKLGSPLIYRNITNLCQDCDVSTQSCNLITQDTNGHYLLWKDVTVDYAELSAQGIVYIHANRKETFVIQGENCAIINPCPTFASVFSIPTFGELSDALENFKSRAIRLSSCPIFSESWHGGPKSDRLFFKAGPEETMRNSLTNYLKNVMPDAEVRPEQVVDDSHPVDIKVTWTLSSKLALIEIKWIGKSINASGNIVAHTDSRARDGAQQLNDYLDANHSQAPVHTTMGYLVVIDGRRHGLNNTSMSVNSANGMYYKNKEITYNPDFNKIRADFVAPLRMFTEPICR